MTPLEVAQEVFPNMCREDAEGVLWWRTNFPFGGGGEGGLRKQLIECRTGMTLGWEFCDHCNNWATHGHQCEPCYDALHPRQEPPHD